MPKGKKYTKEEDLFIRQHYSTMSAKAIAYKLGRTVQAIYVFAKRNGIEKVKGKGLFWNKIEWTDDDICFLKTNYMEKTNSQLAYELGKKVTVVRMKLYELGLKKFTMDPWRKEEIELIVKNYRKKGDVELAQMLTVRFPRKVWTKKQVNKKRRIMGLYRSGEQIHKIMCKNAAPGGPSRTIENNSSSLSMHDSWVAGLLAWRNREMANYLVANAPELIEAKRAELKLRREIKTQNNGKK